MNTSSDDPILKTDKKLTIEHLFAFYLSEKARSKLKYVPLTDDISDKPYHNDFLSQEAKKNSRRNQIPAILLSIITND
jgi:hypothetical protein